MHWQRPGCEVHRTSKQKVAGSSPEHAAPPIFILTKTICPLPSFQAEKWPAKIIFMFLKKKHKTLYPTMTNQMFPHIFFHKSLRLKKNVLTPLHVRRLVMIADVCSLSITLQFISFNFYNEHIYRQCLRSLSTALTLFVFLLNL